LLTATALGAPPDAARAGHPLGPATPRDVRPLTQAGMAALT
jgi:hypothetical protein